jgi:nicotinate-nucleotide adenylyltransferase
MQRTGLYFGSFNPIHLGHLAIAGYMAEFEQLSQIWFVVSPQNPLKKKDSLLADYQRLYMVQLAIKDNDKLRASDIEFKLDIPSYTIDTLTYLHEKYPSREFCLVMGEDNLYTLHKWKNSTELVKRYPIYYYPRPNTTRPESVLLDQILKYADLHRSAAPLMDISGTFIRNGISQGRDMSYFVPAPVWKYIREMHFYEK